MYLLDFFPYFAEVMTGFEYRAAAGMIYEGMEENALTCIRAICDWTHWLSAIKRDA